MESQAGAQDLSCHEAQYPQESKEAPARQSEAAAYCAHSAESNMEYRFYE